MPNSSLILIEEIENGLHPLATRRLVEYLISAAERKQIQVIFTTHSDNALIALPSEAVWSCFNGRTEQGKLRIEALRAISGSVDTALTIFTEDPFSKFVVEAIIREFLPNQYDQVEVYELKGDGRAVKVYKNRLKDPSIKNRSLCIIDGDSQQEEHLQEGIFRLMGGQPESLVFNYILDKLTQL